ncbi:MAG: heavy metal translocating P-type ATPase [Desulfovibrionaceae bacterium]|nr:heavy metal translocating P-type ATPase [Desulfovibrionaceae bacterium]
MVNMDCPVEEGLIRKKLAAVPGITRLEFNLIQRELTVYYHDLTSTDVIETALRSIDMMPEVLVSASGEETTCHNSEEGNALPVPEIPWKKLTIALILAAFSEGSELMKAWGSSDLWLHGSALGQAVLEYLPLLFAVISIALSGLTTYRKGWLAVSNFNLNINALMSVAVTGAVLIGQFPEAAMVMVLFNVSEAIEAKALARARNAIKNLLALTPDTATVLQENGCWREMDIQTVSVGSRVRVKPGERIALDGLVLSGRSMVDQSPITGESMPVEKQKGDIVYAGTVNESGSFEFETTAAAANSTLARIIHAVEDAQGSRAPIQRFVDAFAQYYTPAVFLISILSALLPPLLFDSAWIDSCYTALVVLVIGCPCALVISTPVSIVSGMAAATRLGILIKGGLFLEQGRRLKLLALDKTGTITYGNPQQTDFICIGQDEEQNLKMLAASLAALSDHPVSKAIAQAATESGIQTLPVTDFTAIPGQGTSGIIGGRKWYLGNHRMAETLNLYSTLIERKILQLEKQGKTVVALMEENGVQCLIAVADTVRESSLEAIMELKKLGIKTVMLTGDNEHTAQVIAAQVGVDDFRANLLPEDKLAVIKQLRQKGNSVGMAGDGINDAPALAQADIGFAMAGEGTDIAIETADVALMDDDLRKIPRFIRLSKSTYAILVQNITLTLALKATFFALTFTGSATMWMAVFADVGTALLVVANGLRVMQNH